MNKSKFLIPFIFFAGILFLGFSKEVDKPLLNEKPAVEKAVMPNILFIVADDLGIKDLDSYGSEYYKTPNLDKLAEQGIRFTRAYSASHVCSPTRASILTGNYPHRLHLTDALPWDRLFENPKMIPPNHLKELPSNVPTYAKALRSAGYKTALFGKWHLGNEYQFFSKGPNHDYGFEEVYDSPGNELAKDKAVDDLTKKTLEFLELNKKKPFMLTLMHHTPHVPLASPKASEALYDTVSKGRFQKNQKYAGMISHLDQSIQLILDKLEALGLDKNTIVIFTSDNGGLKQVTSNFPFRGAKGNHYEGGIRIPLIVRWPGHISTGSISHAAVNTVDYFPTFLALAGIINASPDFSYDGTSMLPLWLGGEPKERTFFFHFPHRQNPSSAVIDGDWKLIHHILENEYELFHLQNDPEEQQNLVATQVEKYQQLKKMLEEHLKSSGAQQMRPNPAWDATQPLGEVRDFGTFYPANGNTLQLIKEPYPTWFSSN